MITAKHVLHYITEYVSKSETASVPYMELICGILSKMNETKPFKNLFCRLFLKDTT